MEPFTILSTEKVLDNPYIPVEKQRVVLPNGTEADWFITVGHDAAIIIPVLKTGEILLQRAYKHGCGKVVIEFCAGIIEKGEEPVEGAKRELLEETGHKAENMEFLGEFFCNPTGSKSKYFVFLAKDCEKVAETKFDDAEQIENFAVQNIDEVEEILFNPQIQTSTPAIAALSFLKKAEI